MEFLYIIFYACLRLRFLDLEANPGRRLTLAVETNPVSDMHYVSELLVPGFGRPVFLYRGARYLGPEGWRHTYEMDMEHFANPSLYVVVAKCCFLMFVLRGRTYMWSVFTATLIKMTGFLTV